MTKKWNVVYLDLEKDCSKMEKNRYGDTPEEVRKEFFEDFPEVKNIIGVYEVRDGGCNC